MDKNAAMINSISYKQLYEEKRLKWYAANRPNAVACNLVPVVKFPKVETANGLTTFIENYIIWDGYRATRISSSGRVVGGKYIKGRTRKGAADLSATINGRSAMFEVKVGKDKPSEYQLREQQMERAACGIYEFIYTPEQFIEVYNKILRNEL